MTRSTIFQLICAVLALLEISNAESRDDSVVKHHAEKQCGNRGIYSSSDNGWCCKCNASQYKQRDCRFGLPLETKCKDCTFDPDDSNNQTYTVSSNSETECQRSFNQSTCENIRNTHWVMGSPTTPSTCVCNNGFYSTPERLMNDGCNKHSPCEPGYEPSVIGNETSNTRCRFCPPDTFSNVSSPTELCKSFSKCEDGKVIIKAGNSTSDVQCAFPIPVTDQPTTHGVVITSTQIAATNQTHSLLIFFGVGVTLLVLNLSYLGIRLWKKSKGEQGPSKNDVEAGDHIDLIGAVPTPTNSRSDSETTSIISENEALLAEVTIGQNLERPPEHLSSLSRADDNIASSEFQGTEHGSDAEITESAYKQNEGVGDHAEGPATPGLMEQILKYAGNDEFTPMVVNEEAKTKGIITERLDDPDLGFDMIKQWEKHRKDDLKPVVRMFLGDTDIDDIEKDNVGNTSEIRHQWILRIQRTLSSQLTPQFLLEKSYTQQVFRDDILSVFSQSVVDKANSRT